MLGSTIEESSSAGVTVGVDSALAIPRGNSGSTSTDVLSSACFGGSAWLATILPMEGASIGGSEVTVGILGAWFSATGLSTAESVTATGTILMVAIGRCRMTGGETSGFSFAGTSWSDANDSWLGSACVKGSTVGTDPVSTFAVTSPEIGSSFRGTDLAYFSIFGNS